MRPSRGLYPVALLLLLAGCGEGERITRMEERCRSRGGELTVPIDRRTVTHRDSTYMRCTSPSDAIPLTSHWDSGDG